MDRRGFLRSTACVAAAGFASGRTEATPQTKPRRLGGPYIKLSCNIFSFNGPLTTGGMTLDETLDFCARLGFSAVDPTGYYFPGYPNLPPDEYVYQIKRKAVFLGLNISGTGVRNDFTNPDSNRRDSDVELVGSWIGCAVKLGAPMVRVFAGAGTSDGHARDEVQSWVVDGLRRCAAIGQRNGVMIALQNHNDFIQKPDDVLAILKKVDSEWLALNVDIGSFRLGDPYEDIAKVAPYAITWQIKENVFIRGKETKTDLAKLAGILKDAGYRGYIQLETLGGGDPRTKVPRFLDEMRRANLVQV
jgi:sugar phosphate isomerase/epimerase